MLIKLCILLSIGSNVNGQWQTENFNVDIFDNDRLKNVLDAELCDEQLRFMLRKNETLTLFQCKYLLITIT